MRKFNFKCSNVMIKIKFVVIIDAQILSAKLDMQSVIKRYLLTFIKSMKQTNKDHLFI